MGPVNIGRVKAAHRELLRGLDSELRSLTEGVNPFVKRYVAHRPLGFKHRTGTLKANTQARAIRTSSGRIVRVANPATSKTGANYPAFIERGTSRGIKPTWFLKKTTQAAFAKFGRDADRRFTQLARRFRRAR